MLKVLRNVFLVCIILVSINYNVVGQIWLEQKAIYDEAEWYFEGEEFDEAIPLYQLLEKKGISNANISYKLGVCYLNIEGKKHNSIPYFKSAVVNSSSKYTGSFTDVTAPLEAYIKLGISYRINNEFLKAISSFEIYKDSVAGKEQERLADYYIKQVNNAQFFQQSDSKYQLKEVNNNSSYSLFNPVVLSDSLMFFMEAKPFYDAVVSGAIKQNIIIERNNLTPKIGSEDELYLVSVAVLSKTLILVGYIPDRGYELFYSKLVDGEYTPYQAFPEPINSPSNEKFASMSKDGTELYFSSNRPGGKGGGDIYISELQSDNTWGNPVNLGNQINTPFNEEVCYLSDNGKVLYISSEGHLNMGGHDLFYSNLSSEGNWTAPINFGMPVSTTDDDDFISESQNGDLYLGRFSEESAGKKVIYKLPVNVEEFELKVLVKSQLEFTKEIPAKQVPYLLSDPMTDSVILRSLTDNYGSAKNQLGVGTYLIKYVYSEDIHAEQIVTITDEMNVDELTLSPPKWQTVEVEHEQEILVINDVLFEFDSYALEKKYYPMLDSLIKTIKQEKVAKVLIEGHTDIFGSSTYNKVLAQKRAKSIADYLLNKGLSLNDYTVVSMGEDKPVAISKNQDGSDNSNGRKYNRRVVLTVEPNGTDLVIRKTATIPAELLIK